MPFEKEDYALWVKEVGPPTLINLRVDNDKWLHRYRVSNDISLEGEVTEDDQ